MPDPVDPDALAEAVEIEHTEACVWDHVLWGECFHDETGKRVGRVRLVAEEET